MKLIPAPDIGNHHYEVSSQAIRNYIALKTTALDAQNFPILAEHWPGLLLIDGRLVIHDKPHAEGHQKSEAVMPVSALEEPKSVLSQRDRVSGNGGRHG